MKENKLVVLRIAAVGLIICSAMSCITVFNYDRMMFWLLLGATVLVSSVFIVELIIMKANIHRYVSHINDEVDITQRHALNVFPAALVVIDTDGNILWYNKVFIEDVYRDEEEPYGCDIRKFLPFDLERLINSESETVEYCGRYYQVLVSVTNTEETGMIMLCLEDITSFILLQDKYNRTRPSVILIMIDSYDDLLQNAKESEKARVSAELEKLLEGFMDKSAGIIRKTSSDRFLIIAEQQHIKRMIDERFKILDRAREIIVGDKVSLTLSIGVGYGAATLEESEAFAKQALDMAMSRGGDQAAVKTESGFEFFGGISKGIEKRSKTKTRVVAGALLELIHNSEKVFIMGHRFGDLDSVGGAAGLAGAINILGKPAYVVVDREKCLAKPVIERITKAEGDGFFISSASALSQFTPNSLLIIVDTHSKEFLESQDLYQRASQVAVIDHHRKSVSFIDNAVIFLHEPFASSVCEMIAELIQYFKDFGKLPSHFADALLAGIMLDTKGFVMKAGVRTFEAAAYLKKMGADTVAVKGFFAGSIDSYRRKTQLVSTAAIYRRCAVAACSEASDDIRLVAPQAADELLNISGVDASFVIYDINGVVNISARSMGALNVQVVMEKLGGGGHQTMAACQLNGISVKAAEEKLRTSIDEYIATLAKT